jgi:hypothetical protein
MLHFEPSIRRSSSLWGDIDANIVERYKKELEAQDQELQTFHWTFTQTLFGCDDLIKKVREAIAQEIRYCLFYSEFQARTAEPHFNKWVFTKREDIKGDSWPVPAGDRWTKTNGRVEATIQLDTTGTMTKITLEFANDSPTINFYERSSHHEPPTFHLKNEESIAAKIKELKHTADVFLEERRHPQYGGHDEQVLRKLLHID